MGPGGGGRGTAREGRPSGFEEHGFAVELAHDGEMGYLKAREGGFFDVAERLRADEVCTPILVLTAKDGEYDEAEALDAGADDHLRKRFAYLVLLVGGALLGLALREASTEDLEDATLCGPTSSRRWRPRGRCRDRSPSRTTTRGSWWLPHPVGGGGDQQP